MAKKKTLPELTAALGEARAALADALLDGAGTEEPRRRIAEIEGEIAALEAEAAAKADAERAEATAKIEAAALELAAEQQAAVVAAVEVPGLEEVVGEPLPQPEPDSAVESASRYVARCRAALAQAEAEHKPFADEVEALRARMSAKIAACDAIRTRRSAGDERASAADHRAEVRAALQAAEAQLAGARSKAAFAVALTRLRMAEDAYLNAFRTVVHTGRACGESSPWLRYKPSADLVRAATGQILPTASNPLFK